MKKSILSIALLFTVFLNSGCATVFGGGITDCQKHKPRSGQPSRPIRGLAFAFDVVLFWPVLIVDFGTGAIYKPCYGTATTGTK